jgi:hypothetical protein
VAPRAPAMSVPETGSEPMADPALSGRNRRTAVILIAWIIVLVLVSGLVAWFRN